MTRHPCRMRTLKSSQSTQNAHPYNLAAFCLFLESPWGIILTHLPHFLYCGPDCRLHDGRMVPREEFFVSGIVEASGGPAINQKKFFFK